MDSLLYDARAALRRLPKTPWFTLAVVATLAIAIGANTLIFSVVDGLLLRPLPFGNASRLIAVVDPMGQKSYGVSLPDFVDWRRQVHRIDALASYALGPATMTGRGSPERLNVAAVSANWFSMLGVAPGNGRLFTPSDDRPGAAKVIVISDALWRSRFGANPTLVGQALTLDGGALGGDIVGIVGDMKFDDLRRPAPPEIFQPHEQVSRAFMTFVVRTTSDPTQVLAAASRAVSAVDPDVPIFHTRSLTADVAASLARPRLYAMVVMTFGVVALMLAIIGIYGVLAYVVRERRRELGIRLALGARSGHIVGLVVGQGMRLTVIGLAIGLAIALIGSRVLGSLLFGVRPNDLATYEVVCGALLGVAFLASWLPARGAASIDPLIAMRSD